MKCFSTRYQYSFICKFISGALDYERVQQYTVGVIVVDNGDPSLSASMNIVVHITDANDPPTDLKLSGFFILYFKVIKYCQILKILLLLFWCNKMFDMTVFMFCYIQ